MKSFTSSSRRPCQGYNNFNITYCLIYSFLGVALLASGADSYCGNLEKVAYSGELTYSYPRNSFSSQSYDRNLFCKVTFKSYYDKDGVKLVFDRVDLEPPRISGDYSTCEDKIVVYDGPSQSDRMLATLCGNRVVTIESTGNKLLLVFSSDGDNSDRHLGYTVTFSRIDRGGSDYSSGIGTGKLVAFIVLPSILIYGLMFFFVYRRCKYAQRVRRNLAATGHTPEDIRMAMATMVDQASRRPLTSTAAARNRHENNADVTQILIEHMDASRDRRLGQDGEGDGRHQGRIGQPTLHHYSGDRSTSPLPPPILAVQADLDLYGSRQGSLNSFPVDNCQPDGQHPQHQRGIEDDPHSYGSGRSQGHRTPSPRPHSPYSLDRRREDSTHLAYFGLAERDGDVHPPAVSPSAPSYYDVVHPRQGGAQPPPPSYEEAATGKYNP